MRMYHFFNTAPYSNATFLEIYSNYVNIINKKVRININYLFYININVKFTEFYISDL